MGATTTVLPPSLLLPRRSAADLHSCASCVRVNPALMANPAAAKMPKRPMPVSEGHGQPPAKRLCSGGELHAAVAAKINSSSSSLPCRSSGEDPKSPTCRHASVSAIVAGSPEKSKPPVSGRSMRELIENARLAKARAAAQEEEVSRRRDIESSEPPRPSSGEDPKSPAHLRSSVTKNQAESPESATQAKHPASMRELIEKARLAGRRRDIERSRAEARRQVEQMVDTVQFNDPWIDHSDVTKSPEELLRARREAWCAQAQLIAMARRRAEADPFFVQPCWW